jgi:hypothetical protein
MSWYMRQARRHRDIDGLCIGRNLLITVSQSNYYAPNILLLATSLQCTALTTSALAHSNGHATLQCCALIRHPIRLMPLIEASPPSMGQQKTPEDRAATAGPSSVNSDVQQKPSSTAVETLLYVPQPTSLQKHILLPTIRLVRRFRRRNGSVLMLTKGLCVKYGSRIDIT